MISTWVRGAPKCLSFVIIHESFNNFKSGNLRVF
jgi:hypothetical protein